MDCFAAPAMTWWFPLNEPPPRSRSPMSPSFSTTFSPKKRGRRECRVPAAPAVSCAKDARKIAHEHTGTVGAIRHSPRNGLSEELALKCSTCSDGVGSFRCMGVRDVGIESVNQTKTEIISRPTFFIQANENRWSPSGSFAELSLSQIAIEGHYAEPGKGFAWNLGPSSPLYSVTTILPRCLLASMCSNALPISANG